VAYSIRFLVNRNTIVSFLLVHIFQFRNEEPVVAVVREWVVVGDKLACASEAVFARDSIL